MILVNCNWLRSTETDLLKFYGLHIHLNFFTLTVLGYLHNQPDNCYGRAHNENISLCVPYPLEPIWPQKLLNSLKDQVTTMLKSLQKKWSLPLRISFQIRRKLQIWSHLLKKILNEKLYFLRCESLLGDSKEWVPITIDTKSSASNYTQP